MKCCAARCLRHGASDVGFHAYSGVWENATNAARCVSNAMTDFYELLQISPNADAETIHRVYRFLAARAHPDHMQDGDAGIFLQLKTAYDVLSDPARRAAYDASRQPDSSEPLSSTVDFMDHRDGELNRRLAVLALLYHRRRATPNLPEVALAEIEERMGFPRDYLDFTLWYLQKKGYLVKADNAQYALTADGVDFVESERAKLPILNRLLTSSTGSSYPGTRILTSGRMAPQTRMYMASSIDQARIPRGPFRLLHGAQGGTSERQSRAGVSALPICAE